MRKCYVVLQYTSYGVYDEETVSTIKVFLDKDKADAYTKHLNDKENAKISLDYLYKLKDRVKRFCFHLKETRGLDLSSISRFWKKINTKYTEDKIHEYYIRYGVDECVIEMD